VKSAVGQTSIFHRTDFCFPDAVVGFGDRRLSYRLQYTCYAPARREGLSKRCLCPSVCPSVAYIANNSRIQRPSVPKFGRKVPHLRCDSHTSFKIKGSKIRVTRPISADTHRAAYLPNANNIGMPTNFRLGVWMESNDPHQPQAP